MSPTTLNAEPADPSAREDAHLPPKSYKDAAVEEPPANSTKKVKGKTNGTHGKNGTNGVNGKSASVLRIVNTHGESDGEKKDVDVEERSPVERQDSTHTYEDAELDEAPKAQTRRRVRTAPGDSSPNGKRFEIVSVDTDQDEKEKKDKESEKSSKDTVQFEKFEDAKNGERLISVKPKEDYEKSLPPKEYREDRTLVSGRQAGKRWQQSGIRFAPWNVPLQRRLQTLVVLWHTLCVAIWVSTFFFLCAIPIFWPIVIVYMIYIMLSKAGTSGTLTRRSNLLRSSSIWSLFASYFPARLHRSQELSPTRKYVFGYHPHGIISHGAFAAFATEALGFSQLFPGITNSLLTLDSNFRIPLYRDYALAMGLASVSRESCENLLSKGGADNEGMGRAITIVVGGARESLDAQPYTMRLTLRQRYGFVKMALRTGADLVPVLAFGENDLYDQVTSNTHPRIHKLQLLVKKMMGFTIPLFHARGVFNYDVGLMPYRRPLNIVVGRPIRVTQSKKPKQEEIEALQEAYIRELERLYDLWKDDFAKDRKEELMFSE